MKLRQLGNSGLYVSRLALGTMTFGEADQSSMFYGIGCKKEEAFKILDHAIESGINLIDTANVYGQDGMTEKLLGDYFSDRKNREEIILATKFRFSMGDLPHQSGASKKHILFAVEESLRRLKTDYIDLYQVHMQDSNTPEEETLRTLDDLISQGKVRYIGASNYMATRFLDAHYISTMNHWSHYCSMQMQYHLLCRDIEREHVSLCQKHPTGILVWSPLAGGFLSGKYIDDRIEEGTRYFVKQDWAKRFNTEHNKKIVDLLKNIAQQNDRTPSQIAIAWLLAKDYVSSVIIGAKNLGQLKDNLAAQDFALSSKDLEELDRISKPDFGYPYGFIQSKQKNLEEKK
ncbi:MAG: aldo/keto reductase [Myxococcales bacterium]|nr:aldo/keto reductase [Myxococcales bacterium]USN51502.1 MAG: aldo/keto reductase [Myxococcales bacterium]